MLAGHSLLHILGGSVLKIGKVLYKVDPLFSVFVIIPFVFIFMIYLLECGIAFLQAYVFTLLTAIFIGAAVEEHHHAEHH